jgi:hypothetical protein
MLFSLPKFFGCSALVRFASFAVLAVCAASAQAQITINLQSGGDVQGAAYQVLAAGGGTINLAAGTYNITSGIVMGANTTINGAGGPGSATQSILYAPQTPNGIAMVSQAYAGASNLTLSNLVLDGNIPQAAMLYGTGNGNYAYNDTGIYFYDQSATTVNVNLTNIEVRHTLRGILTGLVDNLTISGCYFHDNNPGGFSHNMYLVATSGVEIDHTRSDNALTGDGLHIDFGGYFYTITKSEFSGNNGYGILSQQDQQVTVEDSRIDYNTDDGIQIDAGGLVLTRDQMNINSGYGFNIPDTADGNGLVNGVYTLGDGGTDYFYQASLVDFTIYGPPKNTYPAVMATGVTGVVDTANWTLNYPGYTYEGAVDFNASHLTGGSITFPSIGATVEGTPGSGYGMYPLVIRYSNGTSANQTLNLSVNGGTQVPITFAPTGSYSTWATVSTTQPLNLGSNTVTLAVPAGATSAPEIDTLTVNTPTPNPPNPPVNLTGSSTGPYSIALSWTAPSSNNNNAAQTYTVYRNGMNIGSNITGTTFTDTRIFYGESTYSYTVVAYNQGGGSGQSNQVTVTSGLDAPPGLQVGVTPSVPSNGLSWLGVSGAASYLVRRSTVSGGPYQTIATVAANTGFPSYTDSQLSPGQTYYYVVAAEDSNNNISANSYQVTALSETFTLSASAPSVNLSSISPDTISVVGTNGFSDAVNFSVSGVPTGVTASLSNASGSSTQVTFTANTSAAQGNYPVTITGTDGHLSSSVGVTVVISSGQLAQTINFPAIPQQAVGNSLAVSATASSGLPVSFSVVQNGICSISGNVVTFLNGGACGVIASQAGNANFSAAANVGQVVQVGGASQQTVNFTAIGTQAVGNTVALSATGSSGLAATFSTNSPSICSVSGSSATMLHPGTCSLTASVPGGGVYGPGSASQSFTVTIGTAVTFSSTPTGTTYGQSVTLNATVLDTHNNPVPSGMVNFALFYPATGSTTNLGTGTVSAGFASVSTTALPAGSDSIIAVYLGATNYTASGVSGTVTVGAATPTVAWTPATTTAYTGSPLSGSLLNATSTTPGAYAYTAKLLPGGTPFSIGSGSVLPKGNYTLTATLTPTDAVDYAPASFSVPFTVQNMNIFIANGPGTVTSFYNNGSLESSAVTGGGLGAAADAAGHVWSITAAGTGVATYSDSGGYLATYTTGGISGATALAIDGAGTVWVANAAGSLSAVNSSGTAVFSAPVATAAGLSTPASVSVDSAGSLWIANSGNNTVTEVIGVAAPVTAPTVAAVIANTLATKP